MNGLSDSNPSTENGGGREVCPIVTPVQSCTKGSRMLRGVVKGVPIFIFAKQKCVTSALFT